VNNLSLYTQYYLLILGDNGMDDFAHDGMAMIYIHSAPSERVFYFMIEHAYFIVILL
jgi:hypothetical protein